MQSSDQETPGMGGMRWGERGTGDLHVNNGITPHPAGVGHYVTAHHALGKLYFFYTYFINFIEYA